MILNVLYNQPFVATDTIVIMHNLGYAYLHVRVVIADVFRTDLLESITLDPSDPTNKMTVKLTSAQTGDIQILDVDVLAAYGSMGAQGAQGNQGAQGFQGLEGTQGVEGVQGVEGS